MPDDDRTMKAGPDGAAPSGDRTIVFTSSDRKVKVESIELPSGEDLTKYFSPQPPDKYGGEQFVDCGGMKLILKVRDKDTSRNVAMAVMFKAGDRSQLARFIQEARITANLEHPNIVPVHEIGIKPSGEPYFTMKLLGGETLSQIFDKLRAGDQAYAARYGLYELLVIFRKICDAVAFAHSKGVIHLDLKPGNVQVGEFGEVLVLDWGLAKIIGSREEGAGAPQQPRHILPDEGTTSCMTLDGEALGTPGYMAPEQAAGRNRQKDERTDIFSLGTILYCVLTLEKPFVGASKDEIIRKTMQGSFTAPELRAPSRNVPRSLSAVVMKAMSARPEDRYQRVADLVAEIDAFTAGYATSAEKAGLLRRLYLKIMRNKAAALVSAVVVSALLAVLGVWADFALKQHATWGTARDVTPADGQDLSSKWIARGISQGRWELKGGALRPADGGESIIFYNEPLYGNTAVEFDVRADDAKALSGKSDFGIVLCGDMKTARRYDLLVGAYFNSVATVQRERKDKYSIAFAVSPERTYRVRGEKEGERLRLYCDGKLLIEWRDLFYIEGGYAGIVCNGTGKSFSNIKISQKGIPKLVSSVSMGDEMFRRGRAESGELRNKCLDGAEELYSLVWESQSGNETGWNALLKRAYVRMELGRHKEALEDVGTLEKFTSSFDQGALKLQLLLAVGRATDAELCFIDLSGRYPASLFDLIDTLRSGLEALDEAALPDCSRQRFWKLIAENEPSEIFDCSSARLKSLDFLKGMQFSAVSCRNNSISSLEPLKGMGLVHLDCTRNRIASLDPLAGMKLSSLKCGFNEIRDLSPLSGMPLKTLYCWRNNIGDLSPLRGTALELLDCGENKISDLSPLKDMPLKKLVCGQNSIESLAPLSGLPIESLDISGNRISSLGPLKGIPLRNLFCADNPLHNLEGIEDCKLEELDCSKNGLANLAGLPKCGIKSLSCSANNLTDIESLAAHPLQSLCCGGNNIKSLKPLDGKQMKFLDCSRNQIEQLDFYCPGIKALYSCGNRLKGPGSFAENPPPIFYYDCGTMTADDIRKIIEGWKGRADLANLATDAEVLLMMKSDDLKAVRKSARRFNGHSYLLVPQMLPWNDAAALCSRMDAHLATITSKEEQEWIKDSFDWSLPVWIGASDIAREGEWKWIDGEKWDYQNWGPFEPNNAMGAEHHLMMSRSGEWFDADGAEPRVFFAEWE